MKFCSLPSAYLTAMLDPTVVVAIAAAFARLGAGIEMKLAEAIGGAAAAAFMPNRKVVPPASDVARGNKGAPAMTFRASRRVVSIARVMTFGSSRNGARNNGKSGLPPAGIAGQRQQSRVNRRDRS